MGRIYAAKDWIAKGVLGNSPRQSKMSAVTVDKKLSENTYMDDVATLL